jgi:hypothetical protein
VKRCLYGALVCLLLSCDLNAAFESYRDRACIEQCVPSKPCPARCLPAEDGGAQDGGGPPATAGPHTLFRTGEDTFLVVRLESFSGPGPASATSLEERRVSDGTLVRAELLNERGVVLSQSYSDEGALALSENGRSITLAVAPASADEQLASVTMAHRVLAIRRNELEFGRVFTGFAEEGFYSVVSAADGTLCGSGRRGLGGALLVLKPDAGTPQVISEGPQWLSLQTADGQLLAATFNEGLPRIVELGSIASPSADAGTTLASFTTNRVATGFALVDEDTSVAGADTLYVAERDQVWKFVRDAGSWREQWAERQPSPRCRFLAARAGGPVLCSAERTIYKLTEDADGGVTMQPLVETTSDGGTSIFRGLSFPPKPG